MLSVVATRGAGGRRVQQRTQDFEKGGAKNFRKFGKNKDLNQKLFHSNLVSFFGQI